MQVGDRKRQDVEAARTRRTVCLTNGNGEPWRVCEQRRDMAGLRYS